MDDEEIKAFQLELNTFGKRNTQRFRILEDLTLSCELCKTPEAQAVDHRNDPPLLRRAAREEASLNKRIENMLRDTAKKGGTDKKKDDKALENNAKKMIDQFTSVHLGGNRRLKLKFNGIKKPPYLIFEMKF